MGARLMPGRRRRAILAADFRRTPAKQIDSARTGDVRRGMEPELHELVRSAAAIVEAAHVEPGQQENLKSDLVSYLLRQQPDAMRHLVDLALSGYMRDHEARAEIDRATEPGRWRRAQPVPSAQEVGDLGTENRCPRVPKMLQYPSNLVQRTLATPWADLARSATSAQGACQRVAPGGEASGDAESEVVSDKGFESGSDAEFSKAGDADRREEDDGLDAPSHPGLDAPSRPGSDAPSRSAPSSEFSPEPGEADLPAEAGEARQLCYLGVQIWRNEDAASRRQAEWTAKLRWMGRFDPGVIHELYVGFRPSPRKARETVRRLASAGKASAAWAEEFVRITADLDPDTRVGLMSKRLFGREKPAGASSNARRFHDYCWSAMDPDATGAPRHLVIDFGDGHPVHFDKFTLATRRKMNAPQWLALYDPDNLQGAKRDLATTRRHLAQDGRVQAHSPATAVGELVALHVGPLVDRIDALSAANDALRREVARLAADVAELKQAR